MKAAVYARYGSPDIFRIKEVQKPVPKENEILIRVHAASINSFDWRHLRANPFFIRLMVGGLFKPKHPILGADVAGKVEGVGSNVLQFKPGDEVYGDGSYGGYAEYVAADQSRFVLKPVNLTLEEAAAVPMAALTALQGLRDKGEIKSGQKVLINGASGGVGSFAVQLAIMYGTEVTAVCSTDKMDFVKSIGVKHIVDYKKEDVTRNVQKYDLIFDTAAYRSISKYRRILNPGGIYVLAGGSIARIMQLMISSRKQTGNMRIVSAKVDQKDLLFIKEAIEAGKIKSYIDRRFGLNEISEAFWYFEKGYVRGKVVITI